ncbi:DNA-directed DNA polymerase alpha catalytic subunit pol1 [Quaeritorhiza haematococci]|nr:DNA-directed DNA polymerase alpha catalytic subunit pol1 [Quaeritorhiza haematococci]
MTVDSDNDLADSSSSSRRTASRRSGVSASRKSQLESLRNLKQLRESTSVRRLDQLQIDDAKKVFDLVDEKEYENLVRKRLAEDDFVINDDDNGYVDYGQEDWDERHDSYSSEDDEDDDSDLDGGAAGAGKRKRGDADDSKKKKKKSKGPKDQKIITAFSKVAQKNSLSGNKKPTNAKQPTQDDENFMDSIFTEIDSVVQEQSNITDVTDNKSQSFSLSHASKTTTFLPPPRNFSPPSSSSSLRNMPPPAPPRSKPTPTTTDSAAAMMDTDGTQFDNFGDDDVGIQDDFSHFDEPTSSDMQKNAPSTAAETKKESQAEGTDASNDQNRSNVDDDEAGLPETNSTTGINNPDVKLRPLLTKSKRTISKVPMFSTNIKSEQSGPSGQSTKPTTTAAPSRNQDQTWLSTISQLNSQTSSISSSQASSSSSTSFSMSGSVNKYEDIVDSDDPNTLTMFWFDAYETNGIVYLFGKVHNRRENKYLSCCLVVKGVMRNVFLLPRPKALDDSGAETDVDVEIQDVYAEFDKLRPKYKIKDFLSKPATRKYAFEVPGIPEEENYLKVVYGFDQPQLPSDLKGKTFSHAFGTNTSPLELLILKRRLKGPCWIRVSNVSFNSKNVSWCKIEATIDDPKSIKVIDEDDKTRPKHTPPLVVMSLNFKTVMNHQKHVNEIVAACALINTVYLDDTSALPPPIQQLAMIRQLNDIPLPVGLRQEVLKHQMTMDSPNAMNGGQGFVKLEVSKNERGLLSYLMAQMHRIDPDVLVGHNIIGFGLDVLLHRLKANKLDGVWSKIGRLRRNKWPKLQAGAGGMGETTVQERQVASGRLLCDTWLMSRDLIRSTNYSLTQLCSSQLDRVRDDSLDDPDRIPPYFWNAADLCYLVKHCQYDSFLAMELTHKLQILPLTKQLTGLAGNMWSRTMTGARAERNEYLLLHEFHEQKYLVPDKAAWGSSNAADGKGYVVAQGDQDGADVGDDELPEGGTSSQKKGNKANAKKPQSKSSRRKPAYAGGLVLEPKKGFYDKFVLLLDFNSLYPSIIQEFNICFTTVARNHGESENANGGGGEGGGNGGDQTPELPDPTLPQGILPRLLSTLVQRRRQVKSLMKDPNISPSQMAQYDIRQKALKLTANSMYGCLGFSNSRFFAKPLAMLVTAKGREILQNTVDLAKEMNLEVIYGDTDSIMIYTSTDQFDQVKKMGEEFKKLVNKRYKLLEIEIDGMYRRMLLLKKKKYAAQVYQLDAATNTATTRLETKGLEEVRRDWCGLSKDVSKYVLEQLFSPDATREEAVEKIHQYLTNLGQNVRNGMMPVDKFVIFKGLTKNPEDYADKKSQPHVQVALQLKAKGQSVRVNDTIPYVICQPLDGSTNSGGGDLIASRAQHPEELKKDGSMFKIGLDPAKYHQKVTELAAYEEELYTLDSQISDEERFKDVEKWAPICRWCKESHVFEGVVRFRDGEVESCIICPNEKCKQPIPLPSLRIQLLKAIQSHVQRYHFSWLVCDDPACQSRTRQTSVYGKKCMVPGCQGMMSREFTDKMLDIQLQYFAHLFDIETCKTKYEKHTKRDEIYKVAHGYATEFRFLQMQVARILNTNARRFINLLDVFDFMNNAGR